MKARGHGKGNSRGEHVGTSKNLEEGYRNQKKGLKRKGLE